MKGKAPMFQMIVSNIAASLVRALRSIGLALKKAARRVVDPVTGAVSWVRDWAIDLAHDGIDLAEHAAQIPGAALGAILGPRMPSPGELADLAVATDRAQQAQPAEPRSSLVVGDFAHDETIEAFAAVKDMKGNALMYQLRDEVAFWIAGLLDDERATVANATLPTLRAHIEGREQIPGVPAILTRSEILETRRRSQDFDRLVNSDPDLLAEMERGSLAAAKRHEEQDRSAALAFEPELACFRM